MKRRAVIICIMMILVISVCIFEVVFIDNISGYSNELITQMQQEKLTRPSSDISVQADKLNLLWKENIPIMSAFIQHSAIDEIEQTVAIIKNAVDKDDDETFYTESTRALAQIQSLRDTEFPFWENIL